MFDANSDGVLDNVFLTNHDNGLTTAEVAARDPKFMAVEILAARRPVSGQ